MEEKKDVSFFRRLYNLLHSLFFLDKKRNSKKTPPDQTVFLKKPSNSYPLPIDDLIAKGLIKGILALLFLFLIAYILWEIKQVFFHIIFALILGIIGRPIVTFFSSYLKIPRAISVGLTMILFISIAIGIIGMLIPIVIKQAQNLSLLDSSQLRENIIRQYHLFDNWLKSHGIQILKKFDDIEFFSSINYDNLSKYLNSFLSIISNFFINAFSILFLTFFFMKDKAFFNSLFLFLIPKNTSYNYIQIWMKIKSLLTRYFLGIILQVTFMFFLYIIILFCFNIENTIIIAFFCALLNIIPYIGPLVGACLFGLLSMTSLMQKGGNSLQKEDIPTILWILTFYLIAQFIDNFFTQPIIYSKSIKSHPVEIFLIIIIGGILSGVLGMILAIPFYTIIRVVLSEILKDKEETTYNKNKI